MIKEAMSNRLTIAGQYRDVLLNPLGEVIWASPWQSNLIVDEFRKLLAALVKGGNLGGPVRYWAVGCGYEEWDWGETPSENELQGRTALYQETGRKEIPPEQITFLQSEEITGQVTNRLQIVMNFTIGDLPDNPQDWSLREFGLFAESISEPKVCFLINHRIHPRIDLQEKLTLERTLRLTF